MTATTQLFSTGEVVVTTAAIDMLTAAGIAPRKLVERHVSGDFGVLEPTIARDTLLAASTGGRVLSRYPVGDTGEQVFIVTDPTRKRTLILDPREYGMAR